MPCRNLDLDIKEKEAIKPNLAPSHRPAMALWVFPGVSRGQLPPPSHFHPHLFLICSSALCMSPTSTGAFVTATCSLDF